MANTAAWDMTNPHCRGARPRAIDLPISERARRRRPQPRASAARRHRATLLALAGTSMVSSGLGWGRNLLRSCTANGHDPRSIDSREFQRVENPHPWLVSAASRRRGQWRDAAARAERVVRQARRPLGSERSLESLRGDDRGSDKSLWPNRGRCSHCIQPRWNPTGSAAVAWARMTTARGPDSDNRQRCGAQRNCRTEWSLALVLRGALVPARAPQKYKRARRG